ncbi:MAG: glycosyltransferase family 4 protein [Elusimicrobia bacterium]|nr:glycosyltransferase family 4 protein [Elusimicrobiota bacterium]
MRILNIIDIPWYSALAEYAVEQVRALRALGYEVFSAAPPSSEYSRFSLAEQIGTIDIAGRRDLLAIPSAVKIARFAQALGVDVLNAHTGRAQTLAYAARLMAKRSLKLVRTKADASAPRPSFTYKKVSGIIAASGAIERSYLPLELPGGLITVIHQGIKLRPYRPLPAGPPIRVGLLGRLDPVKGHAHFIEAAARVLAKNKNVEFLIAGEEVNVKFADLKAKAGKLGIAAHLTWLGHVANPFEFINSCHIGVIASTGSEAVSRAGLEWMAQGRSVIGTDVGSVPEMLDKAHLVPPGDPSAMAEKLLLLISGRENMEQAGLNNRGITADRFSREVFAEKTGRFFERIADLGTAEEPA